MYNILLALCLWAIIIVSGYFISLLIAFFFTFSIEKAWKIFKDNIQLEGWGVIMLKALFIFLLSNLIVTNFAGITSAMYIALGAFLVFIFILQPILLTLLNKNRAEDEEAETYLFEQVNSVIPVYISRRDVSNAYLKGMLGYDTTILMSGWLKMKLSKDAYQAILLHEYAHSKYRHIMKLSIARLAGIIVLLICTILVSKFTEWDSHLIYRITAISLSTGIFFILIPALVQRKCEYEADVFAASVVGEDSYVAALEELNTLTEGELEKDNVHYPSLKLRVKNVRETKRLVKV